MDLFENDQRSALVLGKVVVLGTAPTGFPRMESSLRFREREGGSRRWGGLGEGVGFSQGWKQVAGLASEKINGRPFVPQTHAFHLQEHLVTS